METGMRDVRDHFSRYLEIVREGQTVTVTDHGRAVARLVPLDRPRAIDRLIAEGLIRPASAPKMPRTGRRIAGAGSVSELVTEQRR